MKPHHFAALVNELRDTATFYHDHQSLRERIAGVLRKHGVDSSSAPFDAEDPRFRVAFDETIASLNLPTTRKGEGYRSPITQHAYEVSFGVVNRLRLPARTENSVLPPVPPN